MSKFQGVEGLEGLQTVNYLAPSVDIFYDETREKYRCNMISRSGSYELEGCNKNDIMYQVDAIIRDEYTEWTKRIEHEREFSKGKGRGGDGGDESDGWYGGSSDSMFKTKDKIDGIEVKTYEERSRGLLGSALNGVLGVSHLNSINRSGGVSNAISLALSDWFGFALDFIMGDWFGIALEFLGIQGPPRKMFAASVGGVLVTARSRRQLKKKLVLQRNRHIQRIMLNVRMSKDSITRQAYAVRVGSASARIRHKKEEALYLGQKTWKERVRKGKEPKKDWQGRVRVLKTRVQANREIAAETWQNP